MSYALEEPEGMLGLMFAFEGISDSVTILHGPTGCKQYPADLSERSFRTRNGQFMVRDLFSFKRRFLFYQSRIPCTYLDGDTFVSGAAERLNELYGITVNDKPAIIGIINSPGASLIGEDLTRLKSDIPTVGFESPGFSLPFGEGYQNGVIGAIDALASEKKGKKGVFVLGMGIWQYRWEDNEEEIRRMLALCGIDDVTFVCAGSSAEEISGISDSELNIVLYDEYGLRTAEHCKDRFGTDFVRGLPLGFDAVESWIREVCSKLGKDPSKALEDVACWRHRSADRLYRLDRAFINVAGKTFTAEADRQTVEHVSRFLYSYLGLIPVAISTGRDDAALAIREEFGSMGVPVSDSVWDTEADIALTSGNVISSLKSRGVIREGVEICEPARSHVAITPEPSIGTMGTVMLLQKTLDITSRIIKRKKMSVTRRRAGGRP